MTTASQWEAVRQNRDRLRAKRQAAREHWQKNKARYNAARRKARK